MNLIPSPLIPIMTQENIIDSNYYDIYQLQTLKEFTDKSSFSLSSEHLLTLKRMDDFEHLFQSTNTYFDIIAVS